MWEHRQLSVETNNQVQHNLVSVRFTGLILSFYYKIKHVSVYIFVSIL